MKPHKPTGSNTKLKHSTIGSLNIQNNLRETRSLSTTSDVFNSSIELDDNDGNYETLKKTSKRNLSVTDTQESKKKKQTNVYDG
jgi:hypothetical protein